MRWISVREADRNDFHSELVGLSFMFLPYGPWAGPAPALSLGGWAWYQHSVGGGKILPCCDDLTVHRDEQ